MNPTGRALLLLATLSVHGISYGNLFGNDRRVSVTARLFPITTIGIVKQINERNEVIETCTGTVVGKGLVLTARHCVGTHEEKLHPQVRTYFFPSVVGGQLPQGSGPIEAIEIQSGEWRTEAESRRGDWAILRLERNPAVSQRLSLNAGTDAKADGPGSLEISDEPLAVGTPLISIGYSVDFSGGDTPSADFECSVRAIFKDGVFHHDCATHAGASGGPLLTTFSSHGRRSLKIVGVHTAHKSGGTSGLRLKEYFPTYANLGTSAWLFRENLRSLSQRSLALRH